MPSFLILGAGFTGSRVAERLRAKCLVVACAGRGGRGRELSFGIESGSYEILQQFISSDTVVLHSIPTVTIGGMLREFTPDLMNALRLNPPKRIVYLSTTGVYGSTGRVDERTPPAPRSERESLRVAAEEAVASGPWSSLILRPAAIYGPGRGIHKAMESGEFKLPENAANFVSRIHVDDLAAHAEAALLSSIQGSWPVADEEPCTSFQATEFCAELLSRPLPPRVPAQQLGETRRSDRRVDGSAIRQILGISLRYPSYRTGFPACLAAEALSRSTS